MPIPHSVLRINRRSKLALFAALAIVCTSLVPAFASTSFHWHWHRPPVVTTPTAPATTASPATTHPATTAAPIITTTTKTAPPTTAKTVPSTTPAAPVSGNGQQWNASNTGLAGAGISESSLVSSSVTEFGTSYNGQTISGKSFTSGVTISGNNITIANCKVFVGGQYAFGFKITGDNVTVKNCTITAPSGQSMYEPVWILDAADSTHIINNEISRGENLLTTYGTNVTISQNYMHDATAVSDPGGHVDAIEVYGGSNISIDNNRILELNQDDSPINVAPWESSNPSVKNLTVSNNFLDGGSHPILVDLQTSSGVIQNTRVVGNVFGGHETWSGDKNYGPYHAFLDCDGRGTVQNEAALASNPNAILWPTNGASANYWGESSDLSPNKNGQVVTAAY